jgi:hypothetical protein
VALKPRVKGCMGPRVTDISEGRGPRALLESSDEALAVLIRDLAMKEEQTLQDLIKAVLNDDHATAKRLAKEMRQHA